MSSRYFTSPGAGDDIKFEYDTDDELERFSRTWYGDNLKYLPVIGPIRPKEERRIAGSKRVERYRHKHDHGKGLGQGPLFQSITVHPALSTRSFEVCVCSSSV